MIDNLWYKNTVIYSLDLETFLDADGDGVGDFAGLIQRLDYLRALGVGVVWLAPFQPSPNRDNGYDISDYYGVDPRHGSGGAFVEFVAAAEARGIKVIIDLVVNHTSVDHRWFQLGRESPDSPYRDWYIWAAERPANWRSGVVFPGHQEGTWSYDRKARAYYYHRFYAHQADLNMDNPEVRREVRRIMGYWLQQGVAGFRVDAVPFLIETTIPGQDQGELHFEYLAEMRRFMGWHAAKTILLGESNILPSEHGKYFGDGGDGLHMNFNFWVNQHLFYALATGDVDPLMQALKDTRELPATAQWAHFLRNHDELDLGRLSEEQRQAVFAQFAPEERMQLYGRGIRRRLAPMLGDRRRVELANSLMFSLPGTPVIRYGDEIGMGDDLDLPQREAVRTPMQWSDEPQAGFSRAEKLIHPVIDKGIYRCERLNVANQLREPTSLLNWTRDLIRLRHECPEIGWGEWQLLPTGADGTLAMRYDWRGSTLVIVHNLTERACEVTLRLGDQQADPLIDLRDEITLQPDGDGRHLIPLEAYGYRWLRVGSMRYVLGGPA